MATLISKGEIIAEAKSVNALKIFSLKIEKLNYRAFHVITFWKSEGQRYKGNCKQFRSRTWCRLRSVQ